MKKVIIAIILFMLLISFTGCHRKQTSTTPINPIPQEKVRIVRIASNPDGAEVFIDDDTTPITTPAAVKLSIGTHFITVSKVGYYNIIQKAINVKEDTTEIKVKLEKIVDENIVRLVKDSLSSTLLNAPSKLAFISNDALYISDERGRTVEKVAVINKNWGAGIFGISPLSKWVILDIEPKDMRVISKQFLYALNIETLELIKIAEDDWEGGFETSFELGDDKLIYGFRGVNAPLSYVSIFNFNTKESSYLLSPSKNSKERAFSFDLSPDGKYIAYAGGNVEIFPDNRTAIYLKNLKTGKLKMLVKPSNLNPNMEEGFILDVSFVKGEKKILYTRQTWKNSSTYNPVTKYFTVDFEGHTKEITEDEALKLVPDNQEDALEAKLKKILNKNLHIYALLTKCNKIAFVTLGNYSEKLFSCDTNFSHIQNTGIVNPNGMNFSYGCKFTCETDTQTSKAPKSTWYLIDAETNTKVNLTELFKVDIESVIYIGR